VSAKIIRFMPQPKHNRALTSFRGRHFVQPQDPTIRPGVTPTRRLANTSGQPPKKSGLKMAKALTEIRSLARTHTRTAIRMLVNVMRDPKASAAAKVAAANSILDRGWGKATQPIGNGEDGAFELIHRIERVIVHPEIPTAKIFEPLLAPSRYKGAYGGRGSGKSHFFGELLVENCQAERGTLAVCIREAQRTLTQSSKRLIESKIAGLGLGHRFKVFSDRIETPGDGAIIFRGMQSYTFKAMITVIVTGFVGAVWLGVKVMLGKMIRATGSGISPELRDHVIS